MEKNDEINSQIDLSSWCSLAPLLSEKSLFWLSDIKVSKIVSGTMIMLKLADELKSNTGLTITHQHQQERVDSAVVSGHHTGTAGNLLARWVSLITALSVKDFLLFRTLCGKRHARPRFVFQTQNQLGDVYLLCLGLLRTVLLSCIRFLISHSSLHLLYHQERLLNHQSHSLLKLSLDPDVSELDIIRKMQNKICNSDKV